MKQKDLINKILCLLFVLNTFLIAQDVKVQVFLKNGTSKSIHIKKVKSWGLLSKEKDAISYNVIDSIKTSNKAILDTIVSQFADPLYYVKNNIYTVNTSVSKRKYIRVSEKPKFAPKSISFLYSFNKVEKIGFKLEYSTGIFNNILYKFEGSFGFRKNDKIPINQNFGFGLVYESKLYSNEISFGLSISNFTGQDEKSGMFKSLWIENFDASICIFFMENKYFFRIETIVYFEKLNALNYSNLGTVRLGLGAML